jgi:hypothetical protein
MTQAPPPPDKGTVRSRRPRSRCHVCGSPEARAVCCGCHRLLCRKHDDVANPVDFAWLMRWMRSRREPPLSHVEPGTDARSMQNFARVSLAWLVSGVRDGWDTLSTPSQPRFGELVRSSAVLRTCPTVPVLHKVWQDTGTTLMGGHLHVIIGTARTDGRFRCSAGRRLRYRRVRCLSKQIMTYIDESVRD